MGIFVGNADKGERAVGKGAYSEGLGLPGKNRIAERTAHKGFFTDVLQAFRQNEIGFHVYQDNALVERNAVPFMRIGENPVFDKRGIVYSTNGL